LVLSLALGASALLACASPAAARLSWTGPVGRDTAGNGAALTAVACPSTSECVTVDAGGGEVTFDPSSPQPLAATTIDSAEPLSVACLSTTSCVAVGVSGQEVTFNPQAPASAQTTTIDPGAVLTSVSCAAAASECTAVDGTGNEVTFAPASASLSRPHPIDSNGVLTAVSCTDQSTYTCVGVDEGVRAVTFKPTATAGNPQVTQSLESSAFIPSVGCVPSGNCVAFDNNGTEIIFSPVGGSITTTTVDRGHAVTGAACSAQCTLVDADGGEITVVPATGGNASTRPRASITSTTTPTSVACPATTLCVAVDNAGHAITFDPESSPVVPSSARVDGLPSYSAVSCSAATQCTAADQSGYAVTFNPRSSSSPIAQALVDRNGVTVYSIACPSLAQCTAVDLDGDEVTFNPTAPGTPAPVALVKNHPLLAIACPSATQCTAVDDDRYEVTFNPRAPTSGRYAALGTPSQVSITAVACPSVSQCTAVDAVGDAVTFDPQSPGSPHPTAVLSEPAVGVSCPAVSRCVAIGASGDRATFAPAAPAQASSAAVDSSQPQGLSCPSATFCLAVDAAGHAVEFDPDGTGAASVEDVGGSGSLTGAFCVSAGQCVAVDSAGGAHLGTGPVPPAPATLAPPRISGTTKEGKTLREIHGRWSSAPTSYTYEWERCTRARSCRPIAGAGQQSYRLVAADVGHLIRVVEQAADAGGFGPRVLSGATRKVIKEPAAPSLSHLSLTGIAAGHPRLGLRASAARYGPTLGRLTLSLPKGLSLRLRPEGSRRHRRWKGISIRVHNRLVTFSARHVRGGLVLGLAHSPSQVTISIRDGALTAGRALAGSVRRRKTKQLTITVAVVAGGRTLRAKHRTKVS
jgi:hypothetical protein